MSAEIIMCVDGEEYVFGKYPFSTKEDRNRVNEIAINVANERGVYTYVKELD